MKLDDAKITILVGSDKTTIELIDGKSATTFAKITLSPDQLSAALSRRSHTPCEIELRGLERLNKVLEIDKLEFEVPEGYNRFQAKGTAALHQKALRLAPEGWEPENYYGSQNSFFSKDGKTYARTIIRRWIETEPQAPATP